MNTVLLKVRKFFLQLAGCFPYRLPVGMTEFEAWASSITSTYDLPGSDRDKRFILASTILRFDKIVDRKSKYYFAKCIRAAAAKQISGAKFAEIKNELLAEQKSAEATASIPAVANDSSSQR